MTSTTGTKTARNTVAKVAAEPANETAAVENAGGAVQAVIEAASKGKYNPAADSTPELAKEAEKDGKVHLDLTDGTCACGCKGKSQSRFQPGHDARLKGKLVRAEVAGTTFILVDGKGVMEVTPTRFAKALTGKYDWVKGLQESVARLELAEKAAEERRAEAAKKAAERKAAAAEKGKGKISLADFAE